MYSSIKYFLLFLVLFSSGCKTTSLSEIYAKDAENIKDFCNKISQPIKDDSSKQLALANCKLEATKDKRIEKQNQTKLLKKIWSRYSHTVGILLGVFTSAILKTIF